MGWRGIGLPEVDFRGEWGGVAESAVLVRGLGHNDIVYYTCITMNRDAFGFFVKFLPSRTWMFSPFFFFFTVVRAVVYVQYSTGKTGGEKTRLDHSFSLGNFDHVVRSPAHMTR